MNQTIIKKKIFDIQKELEVLKRFVVEKPDFDIDKKNWIKIKPELKKVRKKTYQKFYGKK